MAHAAKSTDASKSDVVNHVTGPHAVPSTRVQVNTNPQYDADGTLHRNPCDVLRSAFHADALLSRDGCFSLGV